MKKITYTVAHDHESMSQASAELIINTMQKHPDGLYCFAGGDTPVRTLELLVAAHKEFRIDLAKAYYIELDEWVGLDPANPGSCFSYLMNNLFEPAKVPADHIHSFNPLANDLTKECEQANQFVIDHGNINLCLLGVGVNGHLGFNEPGSSFDDDTHVVDLDPVTQEVGKKYFAEEVDRTQGISLGIKQLLAANTLIIQASGEKKQEAIRQVLAGKTDTQWPVTAIWKHNNAFLIIDEAAVK